MRDRTRFDPAGWFVSACLTLLFCAIAVTVAVRLIEAIWPWLVGVVLFSASIGLLARLVIAWHRGRRW